MNSFIQFTHILHGKGHYCVLSDTKRPEISFKTRQFCSKTRKTCCHNVDTEKCKYSCRNFQFFEKFMLSHLPICFHPSKTKSLPRKAFVCKYIYNSLIHFYSNLVNFDQKLAKPFVTMRTVKIVRKFMKECVHY